MDVNYYVDLLRQNADENYKKFNDKISNSKVQSIGVRLPDIRKIAKQHVSDVSDVAKLPAHVYYETDMLKGIVISSSKLLFEQKSVLLENFAETIENWAVCDSSKVNVPAREREKYFDFFYKMMLGSGEFYVRYGVTNVMDNFLDEAHVDGILSALLHVKYGEYYVDMAVAWLIATAFAKFPSKTKAFLTEDGRSLPPFVYNKALQKMRDSFRISDEDKNWTKTVKM